MNISIVSGVRVSLDKQPCTAGLSRRYNNSVEWFRCVGGVCLMWVALLELSVMKCDRFLNLERPKVPKRFYILTCWRHVHGKVLDDFVYYYARKIKAFYTASL